MHPTEALLHADSAAPVACIDPVLLDSSAWHTDYRREGLQQHIDSKFIFPLSNVPVPGLRTSKAPRKSAVVTKKIAKVVKVLKENPSARKVVAKTPSARGSKACQSSWVGSGEEELIGSTQQHVILSHSLFFFTSIRSFNPPRYRLYIPSYLVYYRPYTAFCIFSTLFLIIS